MATLGEVQPLPYKKRQRTFGFLLFLFLVSLPLLYLYATGYRFDFEKPTNIISTGGMYVAVDKTGAEIYIDNELVRETRTFRKAFYAQNLDVGTHRVHVQKDGYHTWVKELPVSKHLVTEAQAFNFPVVPQVRIISEWQTATGSMVVTGTVLHSSSTNSYVATTTFSTTTLSTNEEYKTLISFFVEVGTTTLEDGLPNASVKKNSLAKIATSSETENAVEKSTTTKEHGGVQLSEMDNGVVATWIGSFEQMPYYYCAPEFVPYSTSTTDLTLTAAVIENTAIIEDPEIEDSDKILEQPVQTVPKDIECERRIQIKQEDKKILDFDFFPGSQDLILLLKENGVYVSEIDDRSWQNVQPLLLGENLHLHVENGTVYVYDGSLIYQIILET